MSRFTDRSFLPLSLNVYAKAFVLSFCVCIFPFSQSMAASTDTNSTDPALPSDLNTHKTFEYKLENRPDPFVPFITEKAATSNVDMDEVVESGEPLTGMQLFEPSQLTLVALMKKGGENFAMVQDFTGKGYVLSEGMKIGRRGVVKNFAPQSVIIEETAMTRAGKKTVTEVVMLLKKEGEK